MLGLGVGGGCRAARADAKVEAETREGLLKYSSGNAGASYLISAGKVRWKEEASFWMCSEGGADSAAGVGGKSKMKVTPGFLVQASESLALLELPRLGKKRQSSPEAGGDHAGYKVPT